ncbi:hypothetical protein BV25DRAFT_1817934 [Artomyces pyxidatus]|uniref:Uncharacterized protein n=1 Tax=Artomyces pyxidatus TaxID=48021 RepID=A0ACB8TKW3_9AGAM|nr:hypothetical protein BV25DRAFT_1817934 [Artomyces pyxidatus]
MVKHLPPAVKQLLTLRNPNAYPSPSLSKLYGVFQSTYAVAKQRHAETGWLVLATCSLLTTNVPSSVGHLYRFATRSNPDDAASRTSVSDAVNKAALMREAALKSTIFVGVPRVILSFAGLSEAAEDDVKAKLRTESRRHANADNIESIMSRGQGLWDSIYAQHAVKLYNKLGAYHPDFISFIIQSYGAVLSPLPGADEQGNLSRAMGSVVGVACLRAEERVVPQLTSHVFGLLGAHELPNLTEEDKWLSSEEGTEWVIRTVDALVDVVRPERHSQEVKAKL